MTRRPSSIFLAGASGPSAPARIAATLIACAAGALILWSGTMCILWALEVQLGGKNPYYYSLWPWSRAWLMFSWNDGNGHRLEVLGHLESGATVTVDTDRWFQYPVAFDSQRSSSIPWAYDDLSAFARYVVDRHNEAAPPGEKAVRVTVQDVWWKNPPGRRRPYAEVPRLEKTQRKIVERIDCQPPRTTTTTTTP